ncbi:aminopeptidase N-like [Drosophila busckii]|uniref:aminopeptidase N-like n=1 Tax=Drosophila busckii TaxID=30019 RepID=UPI00083F28A7|nr:aminopeptidase N-like [Drosophila busckii]
MNGCGFHLWLLAIATSLVLFGSCGCVDYRLPRNVVPTFYNLTLRVFVDTDGKPASTFSGEVSIDIQALEQNVNQIRLHSDQLDIEACRLYNAKGDLLDEFENARLTHELETHQLQLTLKQALALNEQYKLQFQYKGQVRNDVSGLFSVSYAEEQTGATKWVLLTEMQAISARLVLPCFDEPAFKAKFQVHIGRPVPYNAISNTRLINTTPDGVNRFMDHFEITPIMSTYLLAIVVSEYKARGDSQKLAIYTRPEWYNYTEFSYQVAQRVQPAYDAYFGTSYEQLGNPIYQYASTPRFPYNSMENWGLVIFKDKVLLEHAGYTDGWLQKEFTIRNIVHENSHMWFGNSVTFSWWSYVWMNEGFARYLEFLIGNELYPEYQFDQQFIVSKLHSVFSTDALNVTQPMTSPESSIQTPADIKYKFGRISFAKAACIVRMWRNLMGGENFDKAMRAYLKEFHLKNASPSDLFAFLEQYWPEQPLVYLPQFFADFTEQVGYPVVRVSASLENHQITLDQERFLKSPGDGSDPKLRYTLPITFATNLQPNFKNLTPHFYYDKNADVAQLYFNDPIDWIVVNLQQSNYYRVFYDTPLLKALHKALDTTEHSAIVVENRAMIVDDLLNFAYVGKMDYADVFEFMEYMSKEGEYIPWVAAYAGMELVARRLTPQQLPNFNKYLKDITTAVFAKLGVSWSSKDKVLDVYNRNMQVAWLCKYQHTECNAQVRQRFEESTEKPTPDYRETFYCAAARVGGYERLLELYAKETFASDKQLLWRAASCTRDYQKHYKNEVLSKSRDVELKTIALAQLYQQNPDLITPIFRMIAENVTQLAESLNSWEKTAQVLSEMSEYFSSRDQQKMYTDFHEQNHQLFGSSAQILSKSLDNVKENIEWAEQRLGRLVNFLQKRNGAAGLKFEVSLLLLLSLLILLLKH